MKKFLALALSALLLVSMFAVSAAAVNWEDGQTRVENEDGSLGNYTFDNAYGYVFNIDSVNGTIAAEKSTVVTNADAYNVSNPSWAINVLLAPTSDANVYEVVSVVATPGSAANGVAAGINFDDGKIVMIIHSGASMPDVSYDNGNPCTNWEAKVAAMALKAGDKVTFAGLDLEAGTATEATATVQDAPEGYEVTNGVDKEPEVEPVEPKMFWVTHVGDNTIEGSGVIFTEAYTGAGWWLHVAFAPVEGAEGAFEITAISDGTPDGNGVAQEIPEGGFVWAANYGNDYSANQGIDYTSENCSGAIADALTWEVGDQFVFDGIDPLNPVVATSTPDLNWYDEAYVCTSTYAPYVAGGDVQPPVEDDPEVSLEDELKEALGEANADAKFDLEINAPETYKAGDEITVTVTVKNITAENGLHVVNFTLQYDYEKLELTNDLDEEEDNRLVCILDENLPSKWENFSKVNNDFDADNEEGTPVNALNDGYIFASALTDKDSASTAIKEDGAVVFTFTFTAKADAEGDIGIVIPNESVEGALNNEAGAERYAGNGAYAIIKAATEGTGSSDSSDTSDDTTTDPVVPGDASSMIVFAIIALVAIAGSAVVIKTRR